MFEVRETTATELFRAQQRKLQGRLRLDISSHCFPANPEQPFDLPCARVAIGERVVQMLHVCAVEAELPASDRNGFQLNALPPPPDAADLLRVMPKRNEFEPFVIYRLNSLLGLDTQSPFYQPALSNLAEDFYHWGQTRAPRTTSSWRRKRSNCSSAASSNQCFHLWNRRRKCSATGPTSEVSFFLSWRPSPLPCFASYTRPIRIWLLSLSWQVEAQLSAGRRNWPGIGARPATILLPCTRSSICAPKSLCI